MSRQLLPARLLVDLPNWVGDVIMCLPTLDRLLKANARNETVLHTRPAVQRLLETVLPGIAVSVSRYRSSPFRSAWSLSRQRGRFRVGITLRHAVRAKIMLRCTARHSFGSSTGLGSSLLLSSSLPVDRTRHQVHDGDEILRALGVDGVDPLWRPPLPSCLREEGTAVLARDGLQGRRLIGLAPAAAWGTSKQWPSASWGRLARLLLTEGLQPLVLIGPGEAAVAAEVQAAAGRALPVIGEGLDVAGLAGVMAHCAAVVGNDSGPIHLAAMAGTAVVALFGPTDPARTAPLGSRHTVLSLAIDCSPCFKTSCPLEHHRCLRDLSEHEVAAAVLRTI